MDKSITRILCAILRTIGVTNKREVGFWVKIFGALLHMRGRKNYTNIARYGAFNESTLRRRFGQAIDWLSFNIATYKRYSQGASSSVIGVLDCSFVRKSGNNTYGLDKFWSGVAGKSLKGLEISLLGVIDVIGRRAWALDVQQTPGGVGGEAGKDKKNRLDFYLLQLVRCLPKMEEVKYWVADSFYAKVKVFDLLHVHGRFFITQLRNDANLRYLKPLKELKKPGPKPKWGEKVDFTDLRRWQYLKRDFIVAHLDLYTQVLYSPQFKRKLRVVLAKNTKTGQYMLLASSNPKQDPRQVVSYYQLRYQIEFLFRDAKQFGGLEHAQTRKKTSLHNHFNMSMAFVNLLNALQIELPRMTSKNSLIRVAYNANLIQNLIDKLGLNAEFVNSKCQIDYFYTYGAFAA